MRILVLGAGGVGGYFGGRLVEAGADVTFLVRPGRAAMLARNGLIVQSPLGDIRFPARTVTAGYLEPEFDLIVVSCKAYQLADASDAIAPAAVPGTGILPLLNGVAHIETLRRRFGRGVLGGVAHLSVTLEPDGVIRHLAPHCAIRFGALGGDDDPWTPALAQFFERAQVNGVRSRAILQDMWDKLVFLATLAGITCLMRASIGVILDSSYGEELIAGLLSECAAIATREGFTPSDEALSRYRATLTERGSAVTASMLRDIDRGAATECEHVLGDLVRRAAKLGMDVPLLRIAYTHLQAYELRRSQAEGRTQPRPPPHLSGDVQAGQGFGQVVAEIGALADEGDAGRQVLQ